MPRSFALALIALAATSAAAPAAVITIAQPTPATGDISARLRWGATGFEASLADVNPLNQNPTLNPTGAPFWVVGQAYGFQVQFDPTGTLSLSVDFDQSGTFGAGETISRSVFAAPGQTSYANTGFGYLELRGNESGSAGRANLSDLVINGTSVPTFAPNGLLVQRYYTDAGTGLLTSLDVTGSLTFTSAGTSQERPAFDLILGNAGVPTAVNAVPLPATAAVFGVVGGVGLLARRRRAVAA